MMERTQERGGMAVGERKGMDRQQKGLYLAGWGLLLAAGIFWAVYRRWGEQLYLPCVFRLYTGLYCPACGGTRSFFSLVQGHWLQALCYHPVVPYGAVLYTVFMGSNTIELLSGGRIPIGLRYHNWYLYGVVILMGLHMVIRNLLLLKWGIAL